MITDYNSNNGNNRKKTNDTYSTLPMFRLAVYNNIALYAKPAKRYYTYCVHTTCASSQWNMNLTVVFINIYFEQKLPSSGKTCGSLSKSCNIHGGPAAKIHERARAPGPRSGPGLMNGSFRPLVFFSLTRTGDKKKCRDPRPEICREIKLYGNNALKRVQ